METYGNQWKSMKIYEIDEVSRCRERSREVAGSRWKVGEGAGHDPETPRHLWDTRG